MFEGPIALYHKGYVRGVFATTGTIYHKPSHCGSTQSENQQFAHLSTKFQQIGRDSDSINNEDWFYFPFIDNDANRYQMRQIFVQGSFEGCIVQAYYYENSGTWYLDRQVLTVDTVIDPDTGLQRVMWHTQKQKSLALSDDSLIPCDHETLHYHPYERFFFYYWKDQKIVILDRGFGTSTGNACTTTEDPTAIQTHTSSVSGLIGMLPPAFYGGFCYIAGKNNDGNSYLYRWDANMNIDGSTFTSTWTNIRTASSQTYKQVYGMRDVGLFMNYVEPQLGYYLVKIDASTGNFDSETNPDLTYNWEIFQSRFNNEDDLRPVFLSSSQNYAKIYQATNVLTDLFTGSSNQYEFNAYPVDFGKYYAMQVRPGTCLEENGGSEDYDKLHVNVMSLRDKAHVVCIDDSEDIYCGNGKWEDYNLEECDDNNNANGDGCSSTCLVETRHTCTQAVNATSVCSYVACGNSFIDPGETCDDGNVIDSDGCSSSCQIEDCYSCTGVGASSCTQTCENGIINYATYYMGTSYTEV